MHLLALPALSDNYIWLLHDGQQALVVDPADAAPVLQALDAHGLQLRAILLTHHHADHVGGVDALRAATGAPAWGPAYEALPEPVTRVQGGDSLALPGWPHGPWQVLDVPGHTAGHIAFYAAFPDEAPLLFCGDTLFSGGCGRLFEGTPAQMHASLSTLAALPGETRVCCAHEYTLANLAFALAVEPNNPSLLQYHSLCHNLRRQGRPTLPSSVATERAVNPFLRCAVAAVAQRAAQHDPGVEPHNPVSVFAALRQWKNTF